MILIVSVGGNSVGNNRSSKLILTVLQSYPGGRSRNTQTWPSLSFPIAPSLRPSVSSLLTKLWRFPSSAPPALR